MMKYYSWIMLILLLGLVACGGEGENTAVSSPPPLPTIEIRLDPTDIPPPPVMAETVPSEEPAVAPTSQPLTAPTTAPAVDPTAEPITQPTSAPATEPTSQPETEAPAGNGELFAPAQTTVGTLSAGSQLTFPYQGQRFSPRLFFVRPAGSLDVELRAFGAGVTAENVNGATPATTANFAGPGLPEMMVYTAQADEVHLTAVASLDNTAGSFRFYLFDGVTRTGDTAVLEQLSLPAGQTQSYAVTSQNGQPVIIFADPIGASEDIAVTVRNSNGNVVNEANFGGGGSAEALYLLPLTTTSYMVEISEVSGQAATVNVHLITLGPANLEE